MKGQGFEQTNWLYQLTDDGLALKLASKATKYYKPKTVKAENHKL